MSFVASAIAAIFTVAQFVTRFRRNERTRSRRQLLTSELTKLQTLRHRIEASADAATAHSLIQEADDHLFNAERDAAAGLLDTEGIHSMRSLHQMCWRAVAQRRDTSEPKRSPRLRRAVPEE